MKKILTLLFLFAAINSMAQFPSGLPRQKATTTWDWYKGMRVDSGYMFSLTDTFACKYAMVIYHPNGNIYKTLGNGAPWIAIGSGSGSGSNMATADQTVTGNRSHDGNSKDFLINNLNSYLIGVNGANNIIVDNTQTFINRDDDGANVTLTTTTASIGLGRGSKGLFLDGSAGWFNMGSNNIHIPKDGNTTDTLATKADVRASGGGASLYVDPTLTGDGTIGSPLGVDLSKTDSSSRKAISLTTTGSSGAATYNNVTGVLNIPSYSGGGGAGTLDATLAAGNTSNKTIRIVKDLHASSTFPQALYIEDTKENYGSERYPFLYQYAKGKSTDTYMPTVSMQSSTAPDQNTASFNSNYTFTLGMNVGPDSWGSRDTTRGAISLGWEGYFVPNAAGGDTMGVQEFHMMHRTPKVKNKSNRWMTFLGSEDGNEQSMGFQLSNFFINDHNQNPFLVVNPASKIATFVNSSTLSFQGNNHAIVVQRNAANSGNLSLPYIDNSDYMVVGGIRVATAGQEIIGANTLNLGTSTNPFSGGVRITATGSEDVLMFKNATGADEWRMQKSDTALKFYNSGTALTPFWVSKNAATGTFKIANDRVESSTKIIAPYFSNALTTIREITISNSNPSDVIGAWFANTASNATTNRATIYLSPHSGFTASNAPSVEAYNSSNNAGLRFSTFSGTKITALDLATTGAATFNNTVTASHFIIGGTQLREITIKATNLNDVVGAYIQNTAANTGTNTATVFLAAHSGYDASNSPRIEAYNSSNNSGVRITTFNASKITAVDFAPSGAATFISGITTAAPSGSSAVPWKLGAANSVTPTSPNRTIAVDINGTVYYIHAKTTND